MGDLTPKGFSNGQYVDRLLLRDKLYEEDAITMKGVAILNEFPAADVEEVRYCRFSLKEARRRESVYKCSACGNYLTVRADTLNAGRGDLNYCPFCGRKVMHKGQDGGQDDG